MRQNALLSLFIFSFLLLLGCAHNIPLTYDEYCAQDGLYFIGTNDTHSSGLGSDFRGNFVGLSSKSRNISCARPQTKIEKCEVSKSSELLKIKNKFNDGKPTRNIITGAGYLLYIFPGVIAYLIYDGERDGVEYEVAQANKRLANSCEEIRGAE